MAAALRSGSVMQRLVVVGVMTGATTCWATVQGIQRTPVQPVLGGTFGLAADLTDNEDVILSYRWEKRIRYDAVKGQSCGAGPWSAAGGTPRPASGPAYRAPSSTG